MSISNLKVLFFGMNGIFSANILLHMLSKNSDITGIVTPGNKNTRQDNKSEMPVYRGTNSKLVSLALDHRIPLLEIMDTQDKKLESFIRKTKPDIVIIACFPYILPETIMQQIPGGCYNLHPSLLPRYRGPTPIFWQFYYGERYMGVTVHELSKALDAGDIILQDTIYIKDGISGTEANKQLSILGGTLVMEALKSLSDGSLRKTRQNEEESSYYGYPDENAFIIRTDWSAQRAYNFILGTLHRRKKYVIKTENDDITTSTATTYTSTGELGCEYDKNDQERRVQFSPGILHLPLD